LSLDCLDVVAESTDSTTWEDEEEVIKMEIEKLVEATVEEVERELSLTSFSAVIGALLEFSSLIADILALFGRYQGSGDRYLYSSFVAENHDGSSQRPRCAANNVPIVSAAV
jgi:hypothetical protein